MGSRNSFLTFFQRTNSGALEKMKRFNNNCMAMYNGKKIILKQAFK
jgi:uncharacterized protein YlzI (FlbEa/FlbD family)